MRVVMTLLVRDEIDLIEHQINFHLAQGVDHFIVTDNGSKDGTREILEQFQKQGIAEIIDEPNEAYHQSTWVTDMALRAFNEHQADWIINSDADEFWFPETGNLKDVFASIDPSYGKVLAPRSNFLPAVSFTRPFWKDMIYREVESKNFRGRPLLPKMAHRGCADPKVSFGNHQCFSESIGGESPTRPITILHFQHLYYERLEERIKNFAVSLSLNDALKMPWVNLNEIYQRGELKDWYDRLPKIETDAERLVQDGIVVRDSRLRDFFEMQITRANKFASAEVVR